MNYDSRKILNVFLYKFEVKMFYVNRYSRNSFKNMIYGK